MAIENSCKSRKAQAVQSLGPLSQSKGEGNLCRLHHNLKCLLLIPAEIRLRSAKTINTQLKPRFGLASLPGFKIRATEAAQTPQVKYPAFGSRDQGGSRGDLSQ